MKNDEMPSVDPKTEDVSSSDLHPDAIQSMLDKLRASFDIAKSPEDETSDSPIEDGETDGFDMEAEEAKDAEDEIAEEAEDSQEIEEDFTAEDPTAEEEPTKVEEPIAKLAPISEERDMSAEAFERRRQAAREKLAAVELPKSEPISFKTESPVSREIPVDSSVFRRESFKLSEPTPASLGHRDLEREAEFDENLALLHRIREEYRHGLFDTPRNDGFEDVSVTEPADVYTEDAFVAEDASRDMAENASPLSAEATLADETPDPDPSQENEISLEGASDAVEEVVAEATVDEAVANEAAAYDTVTDEAEAAFAATVAEDVAATDALSECEEREPDDEPIDTLPLSTVESPDSLILVEPERDNIFESNGETADTSPLAFHEFPAARESVTDEGGEDMEVPEEVADREPFNADDYVISDKTMDEEMATGDSGREYVSYNQNHDIVKGYRRRIRLETVKLILVSFLSTVLLVTENAFLFKWRLPAFDDDFGIRGLPVLLNLQILLLIICLTIPQFKRGLRVFRDKKFTTETAAAFLAFMAVVYDVVLYVTDPDDAHMFSFCAALYLVVGAAFDLLRLNGDYMTFQVVSSTTRKTVAMTASLGNFREETEALHGILDNDEALLSETRRVGFVEGFITRTNQRDSGTANAFIFLFAVVFSFAAFLYAYFMHDRNLFFSFNVFYVFFSATIPVSAIFARRYPFHEVVKRSVLADSAVVGEYSASEYAASDVFVVEDTDLFPPRNIKVKGIKLFGDNRLDRVLCQVSELFKKIGGPLYNVFGTSGQSAFTVQDVSVRRIDTNGIEARLDGNTFLVGDAAFMEKHHVALFYDAEDIRRQSDGNISILYAAENGMVSARFYLRYLPEKKFEDTIAKLTQEGLTVLIRTFDPCVNDQLLEKVSAVGTLPVRVVSKRIEILSEDRRPRLNSGIVTTASSSALVGVLFRCIRYARIVQHETLLKVVSAVIGAGLLVAVLMLGRFTMLSSAAVALYQIFWFFPVFLTTKMLMKE